LLSATGFTVGAQDAESVLLPPEVLIISFHAESSFRKQFSTVSLLLLWNEFLCNRPGYIITNKDYKKTNKA